MRADNVMAMLQASPGAPVVIHIPGQPPIVIEAIEPGCVEVVDQTILGWCRDDSHPFAEKVHVLKAKSQGDVIPLAPLTQTNEPG